MIVMVWLLDRRKIFNRFMYSKCMCLIVGLMVTVVFNNHFFFFFSFLLLWLIGCIAPRTFLSLCHKSISVHPYSLLNLSLVSNSVFNETNSKFSLLDCYCHALRTCSGLCHGGICVCVLLTD